MALNESYKIKTKSGLTITVFRGHFSTGRSHTNYFIDIATQKATLSEAKKVAGVLAAKFKSSTLVDTIICLDDTQVIATCLAQELVKSDYASINAGNQIYILTPEQTPASLLLFRDNTTPMIKDKNVLVLASSVVTGYTAKSAIDAVNYYGGTVAGIGCVFATVTECMGVPVSSVFDKHDFPEYSSCSSFECEMCRNGKKIDALINTHGFSEL